MNPAAATNLSPLSLHDALPIYELPEGRQKTALKANAEKIRLGKRMVTIVRDVPIDLELERARWTRYDYERARRVFDHLRSEEHTSELQSRVDLVCRLLLEKKK